MNEPTAYMTKEGHIYKKHQTRPIEADIPLYEHPPIAFAELEEGQSIPLYEHPEILEDRESAIYATGYWNGIAAKKLREISDEEILALWVKKNNLNGAKDILDFAREFLKKARGE